MADDDVGLDAEWPKPAPEPETEPAEPWAHPDAPDDDDNR